MKNFTILAFILVITVPGFGYNYLSLSNPNTWQSDNAAISEASVSIKPAGAFSEVSFYLTFSAKGSLWESTTDSLELSFDFDLPKEVQITDSWLWMDKQVVKALMLDRSQATKIYQSSVKRRRDPSLLVKNSPTQYQLNIFPLIGNSSRKIKLTFLIPATLDSGITTTQIPLNILKAGKSFPSSIDCIAFNDTTWQNPSLSQFTNILFQPDSSSSFKSKKVTITSLSGISFLNVSFKHNIPVNKYFTTYTQDGETYYQITFDPMKAFGLSKPNKNTVFVLDYESPKIQSPVISVYSYTGKGYINNDTANIVRYDSTIYIKKNQYGFNDIKSSLKDLLTQKFTDTDQFNIIYSLDTIPQKKSNNWISGSATNINSYVDGLDSLTVQKSSLIYSLPEAFRFIKSQGGGSIFIITNRPAYENLTAPGSLLSRLQTINYIVDRIDLYDFSNDVSFISSNNYLYPSYNYTNKLSEINRYTNFFNPFLEGCYSYSVKYSYSNYYYSNGCYPNNSLSASAQVFDNYLANLKNFSFTSFVNEGYNYGEHLIGLAGSTSAYPYGKVSLIGKYKGTLPLTLRITASYKDAQQYASLIYNAKDTIASGNILRQYWAGSEINQLEQTCGSIGFYDYYYGCNPDQETKLNIIKESLDNRVLSRYTAFLAPEIGSSDFKACTTCVDATNGGYQIQYATDFYGPYEGYYGYEITSVKSDTLNQVLDVSVFPNPATDKATIEIKSQNGSLSVSNIEIYNMQGVLICTIDKKETNNKYVKYEWDISDKNGNQVSKGLYLATISLKGLKKYFKIMVD